MFDAKLDLSHRGVRALLRRATLVMVSIASMCGAGAALWWWLSPETIHTTRTIELFALLALLFLPVATLAALEADRRRSGAGVSIDAAMQNLARRPAPEPKPAPVLRGNPHHAPHERPTSSPRHRARSAPGCSPEAMHR